MLLTRTTAAVFFVAACIPAFASTPWVQAPNCYLSDQAVTDPLALPAELATLTFAPGFESASQTIDPVQQDTIESTPTSAYEPRAMLVRWP
jgi:hypothetical protein